MSACCLLACRSKYIDEETLTMKFRILRTEYYNDTQKQPVQIVYPEQEQFLIFNVMPYPYETLTSLRIMEKDRVIYEANNERCYDNITSVLVTQLDKLIQSHFRKFVIDGKRAMIIYKNSESEYAIIDRSNLGDVQCDEVDQHVGQGIQLVGNEPIHFLERLDNEPGF
jgi:hypothetical protein